MLIVMKPSVDAGIMNWAFNVQIAFLRDQLLGRYFTSLIISWAFDTLLLADILIKFNLSYVDERSIEVSRLAIEVIISLSFFELCYHS